MSLWHDILLRGVSPRMERIEASMRVSAWPLARRQDNGLGALHG